MRLVPETTSTQNNITPTRYSTFGATTGFISSSPWWELLELDTETLRLLDSLTNEDLENYYEDYFSNNTQHNFEPDNFAGHSNFTDSERLIWNWTIFNTYKRVE